MNTQPTHPAKPSLHQQRYEIVCAQIEAENQHNIAGAMAIFHRPYYEISAFDLVAEDRATMQQMLQTLESSFPNLYADVFVAHHADQVVVVEGRMVGTQAGVWAGLPPTGRVINVPFVGLFDFDQEKLYGKRIYLDSGLVMRQLRGER